MKKTTNIVFGVILGLFPTVSTLSIGIPVYINNPKNHILIVIGLFSLASIWIGKMILSKVLSEGLKNFIFGNFQNKVAEKNLTDNKTNREKLIQAAKIDQTEKFKYKFIPTRNKNSKDYMIEFCVTKNIEILIGRILLLIDSIGFEAGETQELIDEIWINAKSKNGQITITWDIWDFVFILAENNNFDLENIDRELEKSEYFTRIE